MAALLASLPGAVVFDDSELYVEHYSMARLDADADAGKVGDGVDRGGISLRVFVPSHAAHLTRLRAVLARCRAEGTTLSAMLDNGLEAAYRVVCRDVCRVGCREEARRAGGRMLHGRIIDVERAVSLPGFPDFPGEAVWSFSELRAPSSRR